MATGPSGRSARTYRGDYHRAAQLRAVIMAILCVTLSRFTAEPGQHCGRQEASFSTWPSRSSLTSVSGGSKRYWLQDGPDIAVADELRARLEPETGPVAGGPAVPRGEPSVWMAGAGRGRRPTAAPTR